MILADRWKDYEVLDCTDGEKLERWGKYILLRPDPQVIWSTKHVSKEWKSLNGHYHRSSKGGGEWEFFDLPEEWQVEYHLPSEGVNGTDKMTFNLLNELSTKLKRKIRKAKHFGFFFLVYNVFLADSDVSC